MDMRSGRFKLSEQIFNSEIYNSGSSMQTILSSLRLGASPATGIFFLHEPTYSYSLIDQMVINVIVALEVEEWPVPRRAIATRATYVLASRRNGDQ
jgi:hypothetical protein